MGVSRLLAKHRKCNKVSAAYLDNVGCAPYKNAVENGMYTYEHEKNKLFVEEENKL